MNSSSQWITGNQIVYREVWRGKVWTARPVTVVQDTPELIALYLCSGTRWKLPKGDSEQFLSFLKNGEWQLRDVTASSHTLYLIYPGEAYAVHVLWGQVNRDFRGWYINLQEPVRRTSLGFDFMDQALDIVVKPDLSEWVWEDEAELHQAEELELFSAQQVRQIRTEGERVIARIEAKTPPFRDGWETWVPPDNWPVPDLPVGWDKV